MYLYGFIIQPWNVHLLCGQYNHFNLRYNLSKLFINYISLFIINQVHFYRQWFSINDFHKDFCYLINTLSEMKFYLLLKSDYFEIYGTLLFVLYIRSIWLWMIVRVVPKTNHEFKVVVSNNNIYQSIADQYYLCVPWCWVTRKWCCSAKRGVMLNWKQPSKVKEDRKFFPLILKMKKLLRRNLNQLEMLFPRPKSKNIVVALYFNRILYKLVH